jgi:hypothetical protein
MSTQVQAFEDVPVGGASIRTLRLQTSVTYSGRFSGSSQVTSWVDQQGLVVREHVIDDLGEGGLTSHDDYTSTLDSTSPG